MTPLFVDDDGLCKLLGINRRILLFLQKRGLPPVDQIFGLHYFPAVRQFLDTWYGVGSAPAPCADGHENGWAARKPRKFKSIENPDGSGGGCEIP